MDWERMHMTMGSSFFGTTFEVIRLASEVEEGSDLWCELMAEAAVCNTAAIEVMQARHGLERMGHETLDDLRRELSEIACIIASGRALVSKTLTTLIEDEVPVDDDTCVGKRQVRSMEIFSSVSKPEENFEVQLFFFLAAASRAISGHLKLSEDD